MRLSLEMITSHRILLSTNISAFFITIFLLGCASFLARTGSKQKISMESGFEDSLTTTTSVTIDSSLFLDSLEVPAGVRPSVAYSATLAARQVLVGFYEDSLATQLLEAGRTARHVADPLLELWKRGEGEPKRVAEMTWEDSQKVIEQYNIAVGQWKVGQQKLGVKKGFLIQDLPEEQLLATAESVRHQAARFLEWSRDSYIHALELDPWDSYARPELILILTDLAVVHRSLDDIEEAIQEREILSEMDPTYWINVEKLGELWAMKGDTLKALEHYRKAEDILLTWAPLLSPDSLRTTLSDQEYSDWIFYVDKQVMLENALGIEENLMADAQRLQAMCRTESTGQDSINLVFARNIIEWLSWNTGDMQAAEQRDKIIKLYNAQDYGESRRLINEVLPRLTVPSALFEMKTLAAELDFNFLDEKEAALKSVRAMLSDAGFTEVDSSLDTLLNHLNPVEFSLRMNQQAEQTDSNTTRLLNLYAPWCIFYAQELEKNRRNLEKAFIYYYQAALIPSEQQAFALFVLSDLSRNQPEKRILYGEAALAPDLLKNLNKSNQKDLFRLLISAYRQLNNKSQVEHYHRMLTYIDAQP